jgi:hypothetical protein
MLENIKQETIAPIIQETIIIGNTILYTNNTLFMANFTNGSMNIREFVRLRGIRPRRGGGMDFTKSMLTL